MTSTSPDPDVHRREGVALSDDEQIPPISPRLLAESLTKDNRDTRANLVVSSLAMIVLGAAHGAAISWFWRSEFTRYVLLFTSPIGGVFLVLGVGGLIKAALPRRH